MCVINRRRMWIHKPRTVYKLCSVKPHFLGVYFSAIPPECRTPQDGYWQPRGEFFQYYPNTTIEDEDGLGFYLLTNRRDALKCLRGCEHEYAILIVLVPPQEVSIGEWEGRNAMIAKKIEVLQPLEAA